MYPSHDTTTTISDRFERQVERYAEKVAIQAADRQLTYHALNSSANQVAHAILSSRSDREEPVVLLAEPGPAAIAMLLGALKAGKFYVPLDHRHPRQRLDAIVGDVDPAMILTDTANHALACSIAGRTSIVNCDQLDERLPQDNPRLDADEHRTGYLFYTSGSSGRPKGVTHTHRNILHNISTYSSGLQISPNDRITLLHSHAFSASRLDIFGALLNGATLLPFNVAESGLFNLAEWLEREGVTLSHWVPTLFRHFASSLRDDQRFPHMRAVVLGSESVLPNDIELFRTHFSHSCALVNRFGTTETGNICTIRLDPTSASTSGIVPVGHPVDGVEIVLLGNEGQRVAQGEIGEICVRSRYLSPGYWKNPELTRAAFLPDPDGGDLRSYLSGDLGRFRENGALEHLGRKDSQVKVRGFRVEPREIETLLNQHPSIVEAVVEAANDKAQDNRLIAYLVTTSRKNIPTKALRAYLSRGLPPYMVPSVFVFLDTLPKTLTGKVDRLALRSVRMDTATSMASSPAATDPTEQRLTMIWAQVLSLAVIAATDNFFDLGGNSLLAVQLMVGIQQAFGTQLLPAVIFNAPTIEQLASVIREGERDPALPSIIKIRPQGSKLPFFWVHGEASNGHLADYLELDQPIYGLEHQSQDGTLAKFTTVESIAGHFARQIRLVQPEGPYLLGGYSFGGTIAYAIAQQLVDQQQTVSLLVQLDSFFPGSDAQVEATGHTADPAPAESGSALSKIRNAARRGPQAFLTYLWRGLTDRLDAMTGHTLRATTNRAICRWCELTGWTLPAHVRSFYILRIYKQALRNYSPTPFAGRAVYFKSTTRSPYHVEHWSRLMLGGMELHEVPGAHMDLIKGNNVGPWATTLKSCIAAAQQTPRGPAITPAEDES